MSTSIDRGRRLYRAVAALLNRLQPLLLLAIRLYWGWQFFQTGRGKLMNIDRTADFFASLGIPMPQLNAWMAGATECFGGLLLLTGVASRITSIPLIVTMVVAYATAHRESVMHLFSNPDEFVTQAPFLFLFAAVIVLIFGPGPLSVDGLLARTKMCGQHACSRTMSQSASVLAAN
jgi:putative oxidoreductase